MRALVCSAMLALIVAGCQGTAPANNTNPGLFSGFNTSDPTIATAAFRTRVSACARSKYTVDENEKIVLRVFFKRDGRLAAPPQLLHSSLTPGAVVLTKMSVDALQRCQPFHDLPADRYEDWKTLDLEITPLAH